MSDADYVARRMRVTLIVMFSLFGVFTQAWSGRLPSVREALGITPGQLGKLVVIGAIGSLFSVAISGAVVTRLGARATLHLGNLGGGVGMVLLGVGVLARSTGLFATGILISGVSNPFINVTSNLEGARVEKILRRSVLPQLHAAFPVGAAAVAVLAALTARLGIAAGWHIIGVAAFVTLVRFLLIAPATAVPLAAEPVPDASVAMAPRAKPTTLAAWTEPRTLMLGVLLFAATTSEGAAGNWLNLAVVDGFATREEIGALAYGTFVVSMLTVRLVGAKLLDRLGRTRVLYACGVTALVGLLLFGLAPVLPLAWLGIVLWGMGAAMAWPTTMSAAADEPERAPARVSVTSSFASVAMLAMPPLLGLVADGIGIRRALLLIAFAMVASLAVTRAARPLPVSRV